MTKHIFLMALLSLLSYASCKNTPAAPQSAPVANTEDSTKSSEPDPNDLLHTLQGRWRSEQDSTYILEIADTRMLHYNGACESAVCKPDGVDTSDGWCFTEMTIEQGKYIAQCNFVMHCDTQQLQYRSLSGAGSGLSFKKIP